MTVTDAKTDLRDYLQEARGVLQWKLDGLSEYDIRRPLVATGTNLLGPVKHLAAGELGYFGDTFGRPCPGEPSWESDAAWALFAESDESREFITGRYRRAWAHADLTISELPLDAIGHVPWWPADTNEVTLHQILVHMTLETGRHAGHADIIRELIDESVGLTAGNSNHPQRDQAHGRRSRTGAARRRTGHHAAIHGGPGQPYRRHAQRPGLHAAQRRGLDRDRARRR